MAVLKCKMCGGDLNVSEGQKVVECEYCGSKQTIPDPNNEKKVNLSNRANRLRINCEFDKAASIYEQLIAEFPEEADAYWGLCLCNYGIEYVDDPATARKTPTCHRASREKMRKDENYELAIENADMAQRIVYEEQAKEIDGIMSDILAVSRDEQPYDVFICYKESDNKGSRTPDSVLAQDIYNVLTAKDYRVFFSRITLEDKPGTQYEPYIFAALNSADVMLVVGTDYEYMNAVWVRNEWSRFLKLMAKDETKVLIPCYKDMDPYDMPDEFKGLQSQDCGKFGFMQNLICGVNKIRDMKQKKAESVFKELISAMKNGGKIDSTATKIEAVKKKKKDASEEIHQLNQKLVQAEEEFLKLKTECDQHAETLSLLSLLRNSMEETVSLLEKQISSPGLFSKSTAQALKENLKEKTGELEQIMHRSSETETKYRQVSERLKSLGSPESIKERIMQLEEEVIRLDTEAAKLAIQYESEKGSEKKAFGSMKELVDTVLNSPVNLEYAKKNKKELVGLTGHVSIFLELAKQLDMEVAFSFGSYPQDRNGIDKTPIEWKVLDRSGDKVLLISKYCLDCKPYNSTRTGVSWGTCTLRTWLNGEFYNNVFSQAEQKAIQTTNVKADVNPDYDTDPGTDTQDKIFLLSVSETKRYFSSDVEREAVSTEYAKKNGANVDSFNGNSFWWLRSPGYDDTYTAFVYSGGNVYTYGFPVNYDYNAVRPALWADITKLVIQFASEKGNNKQLFQSEMEASVSFGKYPQDSNGIDKTPIEWLVLDRDGDKALLISKYCLDCKHYNESLTDVTWETCTLRTWLNGEFYNNAFSQAEQKAIQTTNVKADRNPDYGSTDPGRDTQDKVFLLSIPETNRYFLSDSEREAVSTEYAKKKGVYVDPSNGKSPWWLRSPGSKGDRATIIHNFGRVHACGNQVTVFGGTVRPALWVDISYLES